MRVMCCKYSKYEYTRSCSDYSNDRKVNAGRYFNRGTSNFDKLPVTKNYFMVMSRSIYIRYRI